MAFAPSTVLEREGRAVGDLQRISCRERQAVCHDFAARHVHIDPAAGGNVEGGTLGAVKQAGIDPRILVDEHRVVRAVRRSNEA